MKFTEFNFHPDIQKGINDAGYVECTPVQQQAFTHAINGSDILAQSQTGTGKTAAFLISLFQIYSTDRFSKKKALILVPTRELAVQIETEAKILGKHLPYKIGSFYGGVGYGKQEMLLQEGVDFYIATPGRFIDFVKNNKIDLSDFTAAVIDEADRMFDMGFIPDLRFILKKMPSVENRTTMLFSATLSSRVRMLAMEYMNNPAEIEISPESITVDAIEQSLYHVGSEDKMKLLLGLFQNIKPNNTIVFANTKHKVEEISARLKNNGIENEFIIGDLPQKKRQKIIDGIKSGNIKCLIATDVAARGLHVNDLDLVINYDLPDDCENYIHRIGRTARAGKEGRAISLACEKFVYNLSAIENYIGKKIPVKTVEENMLAADSSENMRFARNETRKTQTNRRSIGDHGKKSSSNKFSKKINTSHASYDKPIIKKHLVITETIESTKSTPMHSDVVAEKNRKNKFKPKKAGNIDQRVEYYKQKYGENFKIKEELRFESPKSRKRGGVIRRILRIFGLSN